MMREIVMVKDTKGCSDGVSVELFKEGVSYGIPSEISSNLATVFVDIGAARPVTEDPTLLVPPLDTEGKDGANAPDDDEGQGESLGNGLGPTHDKMITPTRK